MVWNVALSYVSNETNHQSIASKQFSQQFLCARSQYTRFPRFCPVPFLPAGMMFTCSHEYSSMHTYSLDYSSIYGDGCYFKSGTNSSALTLDHRQPTPMTPTGERKKPSTRPRSVADNDNNNNNNNNFRLGRLVLVLISIILV